MKEPHDPAWYENYFGPDYLTIDVQHNTGLEVDFIHSVLGLEPKTRLLDLACGYGRHMEALLDCGVDVVGCDLSPYMLAEAAKRLRAGKSGGENAVVKLVRCDLRALPFDGVFDCACLMFNSFGYFDDEDDNFRALAAVRGALKPGGLFLLDIVNRDYVIRSLTPKDWFEKDDSIVLESKRFDSVRNRTEIDVSIVDKTGKRTYHHSIRLYSSTELAMLLEAAGLHVRAILGGFEGEEFDIDRDRMLVLSQAE